MNCSLLLFALLTGLAMPLFAQQAPSVCERLAGESREQCVREERERAERIAKDRELIGTCDSLVGPEKEHCLRRGGTVEAGADSSRGSSRPQRKGSAASGSGS